MFFSLEQLAHDFAHKATQSPEFWLFNKGATEKDFLKTERMIGRSLPARLKSFLAQANGGFISEGKIDLNNPYEMELAKQKSHYFLTCAHIPIAYERLLQAHPHENKHDFPYIPFMKTPDGNFLTLNADEPEGAIWEAWTLEGPHLWPEVYPSFKALLNEYHYKDGLIDPESSEFAPCAMEKPYFS